MKRQQIIDELTPQLVQEITNQSNIRLLNAEAAKTEAETEGVQATTASKIDKTTADANKAELDANKAANDSMGVFLANIEKQLNLGIPITEIQHNLRIGQNDLIALSQQEISPGPNSEQLVQQQQQLIQALGAGTLPQ